ncbi:MAG TPA: S16 family serine protease [Nitrospira sp.]|nr:S16 family serine protease [Nitrospira sp.]
MTLFMVEQGHAGLWQCIRADGPVLFKDGGGPGCREMGASAEIQSTRVPKQGGTAELQPRRQPDKPGSLPDKTAGEVLSSRSFSPASRIIPAVSYRDVVPEMRAKGWSIPNKGDIQLLQVDVRYVPAGTGPSITTDHHFMEEARQALGVAVLAAAKALRYDPRFLHVDLTMPMAPGSFHSGTQIDGASASAAWAVAVTSAILGDALRQDVCFSGTIDKNLVVGPVGGLEHKIEGCRLLPQFHELLVPAGQRTFAITDKGMARSITVTEVSTLSEAYEVVTGQPLRPAP